jgi:hypothetical protein
MSEKINCYLRRLITEKGVAIGGPIAQFEARGHIGLSYNTLVDFIEESTTAAQKNSIHTMLTKIDFANGDVFDYLDHLMNGMIKACGLDFFEPACT